MVRKWLKYRGKPLKIKGSKDYSIKRKKKKFVKNLVLLFLGRNHFPLVLDRFLIKHQFFSIFDYNQLYFFLIKLDFDDLVNFSQN